MQLKHSWTRYLDIKGHHESNVRRIQEADVWPPPLPQEAIEKTTTHVPTISREDVVAKVNELFNEQIESDFVDLREFVGTLSEKLRTSHEHATFIRDGQNVENPETDPSYKQLAEGCQSLMHFIQQEFAEMSKDDLIVLCTSFGMDQEHKDHLIRYYHPNLLSTASIIEFFQHQ